MEFKRREGDPVALRGMSVRDEFLCPITYEVFRDPVVADDGFTYERTSIEKWLRSNSTSPKTGKPMAAGVTSNLNMKKLIQDLIYEGGRGLYARDRDDRGRLFEVRPEKVLTMHCLGPVESDWNGCTFTVSSSGCLGGRKMPDDALERRDFVLFRESTISRRHFQISLQNVNNSNGGDYSVRDLGSVGGCYLRIFKRKELYPGMIFMCGKHQFLVSSIDDISLSQSYGEHDTLGLALPLSSSRQRNTRRRLDSDDSIENMRPEAESMVSEASELQVLLSSLADIAQCGDDDARSVQQEEIAKCLVGIQQRVLRMSASGVLHQNNNARNLASVPEGIDTERNGSQGLETKDNSEHNLLELESESNALLDSNTNSNTNTNTNINYIDENSPPQSAIIGEGNKNNPGRWMGRRLKLTCFGPEQSPIVGQTFVVGPEGATIGRMQTNDIALCVKMQREGDEAQRWTTIDSAVSSVHAHVSLDRRSGSFFLYDGSPGPESIAPRGDGNGAKNSLNGTWFRISGPNQESPYMKLEVGMELLIGTVRFKVGEALTISEREMEDDSMRMATTIRSEAKEVESREDTQTPPLHSMGERGHKL
jgi:pSer/pThr/pTyr-binding forkhead associated (FHA) protein